MSTLPPDPQQTVLEWCAQVLGPSALADDRSREHPGHASGTLRLHTRSGGCYVKIHHDRAHWESEVFAYQHWAAAFGDFAPRLLAVRDEAPLAVVISEISGQVLEEVKLPPQQEQAVWRRAGQALAALHNLPPGGCFGAPRLDGGCGETPIIDACAYVRADLEQWTERGLRLGCLSLEEQGVVEAARQLIPAFAGEQPRPCHRDYGPANWLVTADGAWSGVIDFEFARWDVPTSDFTRYPDWDWLLRPVVTDAFFEGYGRSFRDAEKQQILFGYTLYALGAIVWGIESQFFIFANEGRRALREMGQRLSAD
jgi:aminoglycoside phosphotransferase (APT) family kinase protein